MMLKQFILDESGQGMTEYVLILALVAVVTIGAWTLFGNEISNFINATKNTLKNAQPK